MNETELDDLSRRARDGDRQAASRVFVHLSPLLTAVSRREARGLLDPEDLHAHAIENLLRLWSKGEGPTSDVTSYLIRAMRNRVIDESRSPRSRTRNLAEGEDFAADDDPARSVEMDRERRWMRGALARLSPDQQRVLLGIYVEDLKPGRLAEELDRSPNAVYSLHRRSRRALRRAFLQEVLAEDAPAECAAAADDLPERVDEEFAETPAATAGMTHIAGCDRCRRAWGLFGSVTSALGVGGILALSLTEAAPASAFEGGAVDGAGAPRDRGGAPDPAPARPGRRGASSAAAGAVAGLAAGAVAGVLLCQITEPLPPPAPEGALTMSIATHDRIEVDVTFAIDREAWQTDRFELEFPSSLTLVRTPDGWDCDASQTILSCADPGEFPLDGGFAFEGSPTLGEEIGLSLQATAEEHVFRGSARSEIPAPGSATTTRAEVLAGR